MSVSSMPRHRAATVRMGLTIVGLVVTVATSACGARLTDDQRRAGLREDRGAPTTQGAS